MEERTKEMEEIVEANFKGRCSEIMNMYKCCDVLIITSMFLGVKVI